MAINPLTPVQAAPALDRYVATVPVDIQASPVSNITNAKALVTVSAGALNPDGSFNAGSGSSSPSASASRGIVPVTGMGVNKVDVKATPGNFYSGSMLAAATAGFFVLYNGAAPADAAALTPALILAAVACAANGSATIGNGPIPTYCNARIALLFTTSLANMTPPANAAQHIAGSAA